MQRAPRTKKTRRKQKIRVLRDQSRRKKMMDLTFRWKICWVPTAHQVWRIHHRVPQAAQCQWHLSKVRARKIKERHSSRRSISLALIEVQVAPRVAKTARPSLTVILVSRVSWRHLGITTNLHQVLTPLQKIKLARKRPHHDLQHRHQKLEELHLARNQTQKRLQRPRKSEYEYN